MRTIFEFRAVWPRWWLWLLACAIVAIAGYYLISQMPPLETSAGGLPETHIAGAGEDLEPFLAAIGADGRGLYVAAQLVDLLFITLFASWLAVGIGQAAARLQVGNRSWIVGLPIGAAVVDVVEDLALLAATAKYPTQALPTGVVNALATFKFLLYGFSVIALVVLGWLALRQARAELT